MKRKVIIFLLLIIIMSCSRNESAFNGLDISQFQGCWRCTGIVNDGVGYIEDFIVHNDSMQYILTNAQTHVVSERFQGRLIIGRENKIAWDCTSKLTNARTQIFWNVLNLTPYQIILYSDLQGEHSYDKTHYPSVEEYEENEVAAEIMQFQQYLPSTREKIIKEVGIYNLPSDEDITFLLNHPYIDQVRFNECYDNDSIYSYTITVNRWDECKRAVDSLYTEFRQYNGMLEYCDGESFGRSSVIIQLDSLTSEITFTNIKGYDYWPNVSHYLGLDVRCFINDFQEKYVYTFHEYQQTGRLQYSFQTGLDGICSDLFAIAESDYTIQQTGVVLLRQFGSNRRDQALELMQEMDMFFRHKYYLADIESEISGNLIYRYYPKSTIEESQYEILLRLQKTDGLLGRYWIVINYIKL